LFGSFGRGGKSVFGERPERDRTDQTSRNPLLTSQMNGTFGNACGDPIGRKNDLGIRCFVNGEERQNSNTQHLVYDIWDQVVQLSQAMTLEPGDLIFTGTPGGIGAAMDPRQFLKAGDRVRVEIDSLGDIDAVFEPEE